MKKILSISVLLLFVSLTIFGQTIKVTNPDSSTELINGQTLKITWNMIGKQVDYVKIRLFDKKGIKKILGITEKTKNDGLFSWRFTETIPDGIYRIKVKTIDDQNYGNSSAFSIIRAPETNQIIVPDKVPGTISTYNIKQYTLKGLQNNTIIQDRKPDLQIEKIRVVPEGPIDKQTSSVYVNVYIKNSGNADIRLKKWFTLVITNTSGFGGGKLEFGAGINAGDTMSTVGIKIPVYYGKPGFIPEYTIFVDAGYSIAESNEHNNKMSFTLKFK